MEILLLLLFLSITVVLYCNHGVNVVIIRTSLHSRVNQAHFKAAHLDPRETYTMKLTCWTWDCLLEHIVNIAQITLFFHIRDLIWIYICHEKHPPPILKTTYFPTDMLLHDYSFHKWATDKILAVDSKCIFLVAHGHGFDWMESWSPPSLYFHLCTWRTEQPMIVLPISLKNDFLSKYIYLVVTELKTKCSCYWFDVITWRV